ncbi:MAG: DUF6273 domain-containing protein [Bacilli bacterium]|nr:DUF6273 domain-containing protein [Bacilli bacterium]
MNKINNKRNVIIVLLLLISIGFAYLSTTLNIAGSSIVHGNKWQVIWDDTSVDVISGSVTADTPTVDNNKTTVSYDITLNSPGDYYEFSVDAFNNGTIDAMVDTISFAYKENNSNVTLPNCIKHTVKYADGTDISSKDLLPAGQKQKYYINIEYDRNVTTSNMISTNRTFTVTIKVTYEQADTTAVAKVINNNTLCLSNKHQEITSNIVCKRASVLHSDKCLLTATNNGCRKAGYELNEDIVYGTCGTIGTLTPGDAFDCDVDGNNTFDEDERFYYVSPKDADISSDYVTLIYYKDRQKASYNIDNNNSVGPTSLVNFLPSTTEWNRVSLTNGGVRNIKDTNGNIRTEYTFSGRAARLLTYQEVAYAANGSISIYKSLEGASYLFDNTHFSNPENENRYWWLETPYNNGINAVVYINTDDNYMPYNNVNQAINNVRPAIEVPLKNISY